MSTLWTPDGEHALPERDDTAATEPPQLAPEEQARLEAAAAEMAEIQTQLVNAPPEVVVANHAMGLYELAAIHLSQPNPRLEAAQLAIDAYTAIVDRCAGRLGDAEATLIDAKSQIQLAFVSIARLVAEGARQPDDDSSS